MKTLLWLAVIGLPLAGGWNYWRNAPLDEELAHRPYAGSSAEQLSSMLDAYRAELGEFEGLSGEPVTTIHNDPSSYGGYDDKVAAFERFQDTNDHWKQVRGQRTELQVTLDTLLHEQSIRQRGLHQEWRRILRRVITL